MSTEALMSSVKNLATVFILIQVSRKLDMEDPTTNFYIRIAYFTSQLLLFSVTGFMYLKAQKKNDTTPFEYTPAPVAGVAQEPVKTTFGEYDKNEIFQSAKRSLMSLGIILALHLKFLYIQPLFLQTFLSWQTFFSQTCVKVYLLGHSAEGPLKRPWVASNPLESLMSGGEKKEDEKEDEKEKEEESGNESSNVSSGGAVKRRNKKRE